MERNTSISGTRGIDGRWPEDRSPLVDRAVDGRIDDAVDGRTTYVVGGADDGGAGAVVVEGIGAVVVDDAFDTIV